MINRGQLWTVYVGSKSIFWVSIFYCIWG
jgi:hypothetical protein